MPHREESACIVPLLLLRVKRQSRTSPGQEATSRSSSTCPLPESPRNGPRKPGQVLYQSFRTSLRSVVPAASSEAVFTHDGCWSEGAISASGTSTNRRKRDRKSTRLNSSHSIVSAP